MPAAGAGARMGQPKLLLPWGERTLIEQTLAAWKRSRVTATFVAALAEDVELAAVCRGMEVHVAVLPVRPAEMKDTICLALEQVSATYAPAPCDVWLLAPADMPHLSTAVIDHLLAHHRPTEPRILVPTIAGQRGHPVLFPWSVVAKILELPANEGLNALVARLGATELPCDQITTAAAFTDIDTPDDYQHRPQN